MRAKSDPRAHNSIQFNSISIPFRSQFNSTQRNATECSSVALQTQVEWLAMETQTETEAKEEAEVAVEAEVDRVHVRARVVVAVARSA